MPTSCRSAATAACTAARAPAVAAAASPRLIASVCSHSHRQRLQAGATDVTGHTAQGQAAITVITSGILALLVPHQPEPLASHRRTRCPCLPPTLPHPPHSPQQCLVRLQQPALLLAEAPQAHQA